MNSTEPITKLYRDEEGHEVWHITWPDGSVTEGIQSDHDLAWMLTQYAEPHR